jgi:hypothetical protein
VLCHGATISLYQVSAPDAVRMRSINKSKMEEAMHKALLLLEKYDDMPENIEIKSSHNV